MEEPGQVHTGPDGAEAEDELQGEVGEEVELGAVFEQDHGFVAEGGEGGEGAEDADNEEVAVFCCEHLTVFGQGGQHANEQAADHIDQQCAQRDGNFIFEDLGGKDDQIAQDCANGSAGADDEDVPHRINSKIRCRSHQRKAVKGGLHRR